VEQLRPGQQSIFGIIVDCVSKLKKNHNSKIYYANSFKEGIHAYSWPHNMGQPG
jgi:hypothetical protein